ncbi:MAG: hypothetical protein IIZ48_05780, partial [Erysipelotrichales bacterium]|nr:hypothetical protein [Erysipelotrichales bacterium]
DPQAYYAEKPDRLTEDEKLYLSKIVYYAYDISEKTLADYVKCQLLIWDVIGNEIHFSTHDYYFNEDTHYESITFEAKVEGKEFGINSEAYKSYKKSVMKYVKNAPDFDKKEIHLKSGESAVITDRNGVISTYSVSVNNTGTVLQINGDKVTVTADKNSVSGTVSFKRTSSEYDKNQGAVIVYENKTGQDKATFKLMDQTEYSIKVNVIPYAEISVMKKDPEGKGLAGAVLELYDKDQMNTPVKRWTSDGNKMKIGELQCEHMYVLREMSAPKGYVKAKDVSFRTGKNGSVTEITMTDGVLEIVKEDEKGNTVSGAKLQILKEGKVLDEWISNQKPHIPDNLTEGESYILHEVAAPEGYALMKDITFTASSERLTVKAKNMPVTVKKTDDEGNPVSGAKLAVYGLNGQEIDSWITDSSGEHRISGLQNGTVYVLKETDTPFGYKTAQEIRFMPEENNGVINMVDEPEKVYVSVIKKDTLNPALPVSGCEFTVYRISDGNEVMRLMTDEEGKAQGTLRYDSSGYYLMETRAASGYQNDHENERYEIIPGEEYTFEENDKTFEFVISDRPLKKLRIVKKDAVTGEIITLSPAVFKLTDADGNETVLKNGESTWSSYMTNSDKSPEQTDAYCSETDQKGTAEFPFRYPDGFYTLEEIQAPEGYVQGDPLTLYIGNLIELKRSESDVYYPEITSEDGYDVYTIVVQNDPVLGSLEVFKDFPDTGADTSFIDRTDRSGFEFGLFAQEDIVNPANGQILYSKDECAVKGSTDQNGYLLSEGLYPGNYYVRELSQSARFVENEEKHPVVISNESSSKCRYTALNTPTVLRITKTGLNGTEEIPGAAMELTDENGTVLDSWISSDVPHIMEGLEMHQTYILKETAPPDGYYSSEEIKFTLDSGVTDLVMKDAPVVYEIEKTDEDGNPVEGAVLELYDITGEEAVLLELMPEKTGKEPVLLDKKLIAGHSYRITEITAPSGYYKSDSVEFTVPEHPENFEKVIVSVIDRSVSVKVKKVDDEGNPVSGALLQILRVNSDKEEETVYEFQSDLSAEGIDVSEYLEGDGRYILREKDAPYGYKKAEDQSFTVVGDTKNPQTLEIVNERIRLKVRIEKVDSKDGNVHLSGARFEVFDPKTGETVNDVNGKPATGTTGDDGILEFELYDKEGGYQLRETKAPIGYGKTYKIFEVKRGNESEEEGVIRITVENDPFIPVVTSAIRYPFLWYSIMAVSVLIVLVLLGKYRLNKMTG